MTSKNTLKIKNLPKELSNAEKEDFLEHFGAQTVKIITSASKQKSVAFAKFETKEIAEKVLHRLHQITVLNNQLCVEYASHDIGQGRPKCTKVQDQGERRAAFFNNFVNKINAFNNSVNYNQPPPAHLRYSYPKANRATISNIAHALATVPKFYTQVLHLMNKMNLPPPFVIEDPSQLPARHQSLQELQKPSQAASGTSKTQSSSESELESDTENQDKTKMIIPGKRILPQKKQVKRPKFIKPNVVHQSSTSKPVEKVDDVFEKVNIPQRKIEMKVSGDALEKTNLPKHELNVNIVTEMSNNDDAEEIKTEEDVDDGNKVISDKELAANQIPKKDLGVLPVFKNYHPGAPTNRLYIKNIAKTIELKDFEYIYNRYKVEHSEKAPSQFGIRLMQEGRMKGQAFVTLDSVDLAQKALTETNGFILKEKPLVVVFAKSAAAKK